MSALDSVETIVVLMMENRSFDHVLGHMSLPDFGNRGDVDGLRDPDDNPLYVNLFENVEYSPFVLTDKRFTSDMPHSREQIQTELAFAGGNPTMRGFVEAYVKYSGNKVQDPPVMGYLTPPACPVSSFLAQTYLVCDRWFAPLPTDTHPNRTMAFTGSSLIDSTGARLIPHKDLVFDWLDRNAVRWRVYHSGLSFFMLFEPDGIERALSGDFRNVRDLGGDVANESDATWPSVIFIEPEYDDSPIHLFGAPNDNHPPLAFGPGENFLRNVYSALTMNPTRWAKTLFLITYDEHGGFFDHVPPLPVKSAPPPGSKYQQAFTSTGLRVPTIVASPLVKPGGVFNGALDHTSFLQLLGDKFAGGPDKYSDDVNRRRDQGIGSLSQALAPAAAPAAVPKAAPIAPLVTLMSEVALDVAKPTDSNNRKAFLAAAQAAAATGRPEALKRFPELVNLPKVTKPGP